MRINDFKDRFSLFFINDTELDLVGIDKVFSGFKNYKKHATEVFNSYPAESDFDYNSLIEHYDKMFELNVLEVFLIKHNEDFLDIYNAYNNIRIVAQDGLFINNTNDLNPLEISLKSFFIEATQFQHSPWDEIDTPQSRKINKEYLSTLENNRKFQNRLKENIITSFEIKKELIPEIKKIININKNDIYPNQVELV
ncbi:hypothetical protein [Flavobacterium turcicum]|uniref:hypothetical protein n=1 Tax=Flavobacterium turcicum TaxID=2764718 RepID=UPI0021D18AE8|nr:hypothetical protein [Flavobacterium turcicum]